jgi:DNA-binding response OmpR family regulator
MPVQALLFTTDPVLKRTFSALFQAAQVRTFQAGTWVEALNQIKHHRFDAVVVDATAAPDALDLLTVLRKGKRSRGAIGFCTVGDVNSTRRAYEAGSHFVLIKPVSEEIAARTLRAALGMVLTQRRRYHRHHLNLTAKLLLANGEELAVEIVNLSESGAALEMKHEHHRQAEGNVRLRFRIPAHVQVLEAAGTVHWVSAHRIGMQFGKMTKSSRTALDSWLLKRAEHSPMFKNAPNALRALAARA